MLFIKKLSWSDFTILVLLAGVVEADTLRYRGAYTYGHEVNTFCPEINSQCYWLSGGTGQNVRDELMALSAANTGKPYQPLCVVLEGEIDRESARDGFVVDYDGLITATQIFGPCGETDAVTQGDLQHHRWILESINDQSLPEVVLENKIPDLDFGEQMTVSGNSGCNRFSGRATFADNRLDFGNMMSTAMACLPEQNTVEGTLLRVLGEKPIVTLDEEKNLVLESSYTILRYRLRDWVD